MKGPRFDSRQEQIFAVPIDKVSVSSSSRGLLYVMINLLVNNDIVYVTDHKTTCKTIIFSIISKHSHENASSQTATQLILNLIIILN